MSVPNVFLRPADFYQCEINPIAHYIDQSSFFIAKMKRLDREMVRSALRDRIKTGQLGKMVDPEVHYYEKQENGDREPRSTKLSKYIQKNVQQGNVIAPTLTCYTPAEQEESLLTEFTDDNVRVRGVAKKEAQAAEARGDIVVATLKGNEQTNRKLFNNALSGAFASSGTPLHNPTAHSTLTTITRTESSIGNASNEKMVSGNRHYFSYDVTLNNIISLASSVDEAEMTTVCDKYGLVYPTVEDVEKCIRHSTMLYWADESKFVNIMAFVRTLSPAQRAGVVYISDMYHIRQLNTAFMRKFIDQLKMRVTGKHFDDPAKFLKSSDEMFVNAAHQICMEIVTGIGKDYSLITHEQACVVAATTENLVNTVLEYRDFIEAFFLTKNLPASTAYIPSMIRRSVVLSDTDSTMFSVDEWMDWYWGYFQLNYEAYALGAAVMFMATQVISHALALFSANMNVQRKKLFQIQMKPEFLFPVFALTNVAKHYYAGQLVKEGNVYKKIKMEIKGVHLKNSAAPKVLMDAVEKRMEAIILRIMAGEKISLKSQITEVANIERKITESILAGDTVNFKKGKVKAAQSYKKGPEESPYQQDIWWYEVMKQKYGSIAMPPYSVIKIPTTLKNPTKLRQWIESLEDKQFAARMQQWLTRKNKKNLPTIYLPVLFVQANGIPAEFRPIINIKKILLDLTLADRMVLETLGFYAKSDWLVTEMGY